MESYSLRSSFNLVISELNEASARSNIIKLAVDIRLPDEYKGNANDLISATRRLTSFLSDRLINGIITIEIRFLKSSRTEVSFLLQISGKGSHRKSTEGSSEIQQLVESITYDVDYFIEENEIRFGITVSAQETEVKSAKSKLPFYKKRILLAEDNEINAMVFSSFLEEWGCENTMAINGEEAVSIAHEHEFDAILMDIFMPMLNGNQATKRIREFNSNIPIIALTASTREEDIREAVAAGANDYLLKPVSSAHLYQVLNKYLQHP